MAAQVLKDQKIWLGGLDLTGDTNAIGVDPTVETEDNTTFGDGNRSNVGGLLAVTASIEGIADPETADAKLFDALGVEGEPLSYGDSGDQGAVVYTMPALIGSYAPGGEIGRLFRFTASAVSRKLVRGTLMENLTGVAATGNGTARELGAVAAAQKLYAALHVLAVDDPGDSLTIEIESDSAAGFSTPTTRLSFSAVNAVSGVWAVPVAGPITDTWWRVTHTVAGTSPAFAYAAILGIQ